ncbi:Krr1-domain-containing protein [Lentithecium fluviatile CBS 122367]|uniref:Krr1-domain-containing protein n=1 Tax=Lentithecium fluviatile CBS 122367 TaxID=1168545 RepID=A0A6G1JEK5_9PLEO|nr:Krr1-domain-containing protein [Lentithecium fluviatile CBS 122367]
MPKTKQEKPNIGVKRQHVEAAEAYVPLDSAANRPAKKTKLLDDSDDETDGEAGGVALKVNEEYARRFEYNKKREDKHRLEEKYGKGKALQDGDDDSEDSEEGVEEDDAGEFVTEELDQEISATLQALRSKDPRIYDSNVKFFHETDELDVNTTNGTKKEESMTLREYHTKNLLEGKFGEEEDAPRKTYAQEQEEARQNLVKELKAGDSDDDEGDFLVAKSRPEPEPSKKERVKITVEDVVKADRDPETFLSNYMASRAWVPKGDSRFQPLESDDEDYDAAAEEWENSYNLYFEDTTGANEKLVTYARDAVAKTTVRRDEQSSRRKAREAARAKREAERKEREDDLARLRKLKIEEMEQKVQKIRETGGLKGRDFNVAEWKEVLEADWSDDQWDREMKKRFGDAYYDNGEAVSDDDIAPSKKKKKPKKPKFDDDIDIKDLVPDFDDEEVERPTFTLSSDDEDDEADAEEDDEEEEGTKPKKSSKQRKQERAEAKSASRRDRRLIETLVDDSLQYETALASSKSMAPSRFRYRETSPTAFGMTPRDILLASDKQLNEFAGLKKLATFRDPAKKKKDKKQLSKKARLRQWRLDTFGDPDGPKGGFEVLVGEEEGKTNGDAGRIATEDGLNIKEGGSKTKKRNRKGKVRATDL